MDSVSENLLINNDSGKNTSKLAVIGDVAVHVCSVMVTAQGWFKQICTLHPASFAGKVM